VFQEAAIAEERAAAKAAPLRAAINPLEAEMVKLGKEMAEYRQLLDQGVISVVIAAKRLSDVDMNLRRWRQSVEQAQGYTFKAVIIVIATGLVGMVSLGIKTALGK